MAVFWVLLLAAVVSARPEPQSQFHLISGFQPISVSSLPVRPQLSPQYYQTSRIQTRQVSSIPIGKELSPQYYQTSKIQTRQINSIPVRKELIPQYYQKSRIQTRQVSPLPHGTESISPYYQSSGVQAPQESSLPVRPESLSQYYQTSGIQTPQVSSLSVGPESSSQLYQTPGIQTPQVSALPPPSYTQQASNGFESQVDNSARFALPTTGFTQQFSSNEGETAQQPLSTYSQQSTQYDNQGLSNIRYSTPTGGNVGLPNGIQDSFISGNRYAQSSLSTGVISNFGLNTNIQENGLHYQGQGQGLVNSYVQPIIHKNVYVHVPPPDTVEEQQEAIRSVAPRTNYKIIFIKAPTVPTLSQKIIQQQQQSREKTIVYVLVKKPSEPEAAKLSELPEAPPSKPEVYFIKYKARNADKDISPSSDHSVTQSLYGAPAIASPPRAE